MGAPYCPPDRNAIRAMGAKVCFIGVPWDQGQVVRAGTSQGAAGIREASTQYFPYMFEYDVDLLTFFRIVDCGDIPIVPGNNEKSHEYIYHYLTECLHGGAKVVLVRRRSFGADPRRPRALRFSQDRAHRLSPRRLPSRRGAGLGGQRLHQLLRPFPRARPAELQRQEHGAYGLAQRAQPEGLARLLRRQRGAPHPDAGARRPRRGRVHQGDLHPRLGRHRRRLFLLGHGFDRLKLHAWDDGA